MQTFIRHKILFVALLFCSSVYPCRPALAGVDWSQVGADLQLTETPLDVAGPAAGKWTLVLVKGKVLVYGVGGRAHGAIEVDPEMDRLSLADTADFLTLSSSKTRTIRQIKVAFPKEIDITGSPFRGPEQAPVTMVVFSDFQCPACAQAEPLLEKIRLANAANMKVVFKNYPLKRHPLAEPAALAALAAFEQGKFWEFHDLLFRNNKNMTEETITAVATEIGLDMAQFRLVMESSETRKKMEKDIQDGQTAGIKGTPTIFINGREVVQGTFIQKLIDEELALSVPPAK